MTMTSCFTETSEMQNPTSPWGRWGIVGNRPDVVSKLLGLRCQAAGKWGSLSLFGLQISKVLEVPGFPSLCAKRDVGSLQTPDLVPLNNTIYNYRTGVCTAFSPDIVLLSKAKTNLVPDAQHPYLVDNEGERFDFDEWLLDLFDGDEQRVEAVWQMIAALLRTNVSWDRA